MKKPKCKKCNRSISRTIGFTWECSSVYYLNTMRTSGWNNFLGSVFKIKKGPKNKSCWTNRHKKVLAFYCNKCGNKFPDVETKSIRKYLLSDHVLLRLKDDPYHNGRWG